MSCYKLDKGYSIIRATLTKIQLIKINHTWTQIIYSTPKWSASKIQKIAFVKKKKNAVKSPMVIF